MEHKLCIKLLGIGLDIRTFVHANPKQIIYECWFMRFNKVSDEFDGLLKKIATIRSDKYR
jgi:hypothetical protein